MDKYFSSVQKRDEKRYSLESKAEDLDVPQKKALPKGVVLGKDGKPYVHMRFRATHFPEELKFFHRCRSCTSFGAWAAMAKSDSTNPAVPAVTPAEMPSDCPPDVETLGRGTWTFLHTLSASYPPTASTQQQSEMKQFIHLFSKLYPCWHCAEDFQAWMGTKGNEPQVQGRGEFGKWMCEAHNEVNRKLGKTLFDCGRWEERWKTGPKDGSCG